MSRYDYKKSQEIAGRDYSFCALIMAAMRQADTENSLKLKDIFPDIWNELSLRYNAPGGYLTGEKPDVH